MLQETDHPLMERVISGPLEDNAKIFIMDKDKVDVITQEVGGQSYVVDGQSHREWVVSHIGGGWSAT